MLTTMTPWAEIKIKAVHVWIAFGKPEYKLPKNTSQALVFIINRIQIKDHQLQNCLKHRYFQVLILVKKLLDS